MTTTRAAKYLAAVDLGKTITVTHSDTGKTVTGELQSIDAINCNIELGILAGKDSGEYRVAYDSEVTITGRPGPTGEDQAPQPLPAPIPAAQAADASSYYGPACCVGECCGPGSYCCKHPDNNHDHDDEQLEHSHYYALGQDECLGCGQPPIDPEPRPRGYEENQK